MVSPFRNSLLSLCLYGPSLRPYQVAIMKQINEGSAIRPYYTVQEKQQYTCTFDQQRASFGSWGGGGSKNVALPYFPTLSLPLPYSPSSIFSSDLHVSPEYPSLYLGGEFRTLETPLHLMTRLNPMVTDGDSWCYLTRSSIARCVSASSPQQYNIASLTDGHTETYKHQ